MRRAALLPHTASVPRPAAAPVATVLLVLLAVTGCTGTGAPPAPAAPAVPAHDVKADLAAIARLRDEYVAAHNSGDIDRLMALWAEDAVFMPADEPNIFGRAAIREHIQEILDQIPARVALSLEETRVAGDWAFDRGIETVTMGSEASGESVTMRVKYICILQRQPDQSWKFARYIYNLE
jgi:uncharacterized protein (TIGR02246 family)